MSESYTNPVLPGFYPDPSVCRVGEDFYLVTSSFEYFPGVPVFHSRDLVHWTQIGHCLTRPSQLDLSGAKSSGGIYAPTIRHHDGRFYMVTTDTSGIGNFFVTTDDPAGEWSDPVRVDQGGIDPSLHFENGRCWFASNGLHWNRDGLYLSEIDAETGQRKSEPKWLWAGAGGKFPEAPHLYRRGGWTYLICAEGGTEFAHAVTIARSRAIDGPYEPCPHNPILCHAGSYNGIQSTGHAELFDDPHGNWWMVCLGVRHAGYPLMHHLGRETHLAPVTWTDDGWPVVHGGREIELEMRVAALPGPADPAPTPRVRDAFDEPELALGWNFRRNPVADSWSLTERPGWLTLHGQPATLGDAAPLALVARRQQHFECRAQTLLDFTPRRAGDEAGVTAIMNEHHHHDLFVTVRDGQRAVVLRRTVGSLVAEVARQPVGDGPVELRIEADETWYRFAWRAADGADDAVWHALGPAETRHLSTELAGGFTGVYLGMYAVSPGGGGGPAHFDHFDYDAPGDATDRSTRSVTTAPADRGV